MVNIKQKEKLKELLINFQCGHCLQGFDYGNGRYELILVTHHSNRKDRKTLTFCSADCLDKWNHTEHGLAVL